MEQRVRFELTVLQFCRLLHWATLPPLHKAYREIGCRGRIRTTDLQLMRLAGTAVLPYSAIILVDRPGIEPGIEACKATVFPSIPTAHFYY